MTGETANLFKHLLKDIDYEQVILFGSQARDAAGPGSDYDLLIIMPNALPLPEKIRLLLDSRRKLAQHGIDADIIIKSREEVNRCKDKIGSVVKNALTEGIVL